MHVVGLSCMHGSRSFISQTVTGSRRDLSSCSLKSTCVVGPLGVNYLTNSKVVSLCFMGWVKMWLSQGELSGPVTCTYISLSEIKMSMMVFDLSSIATTLDEECFCILYIIFQ